MLRALGHGCRRVCPVYGNGLRQTSGARSIRLFGTSAFDTNDPEIAYAHKSTVDLIRTLLVFRVCSWKWFVSNSDTLLMVSKKMMGERLVNAIIRRTFFAQFCGGEDEEDIKPTIRMLNARGVGAILDYAAEADLSEEEDVEKMANDENVARSYCYTSEIECDKRKDIFMDAITAVHNVTPEGFAAIKVTALGNPQLLQRISTMKRETMNLFSRFDLNGDGTLSFEEFDTAFREMFHPKDEDQTKRMFEAGLSLSRPDIRMTKTSNIDLVDWMRLMSSADICQLTKQCKHQGPLYHASLSEEEMNLMEAMYARLEDLASHAAAKSVRLMVDAEQTYFQSAIDAMVTRLQRKYNTESCTIFNTYQCYLKDSRARLESDILRAQRENFRFAAKLVRGAYMHSERELAIENGVPSPIHDTLEDTHASFDGNLAMVLHHIHASDEEIRAEVMVASHNHHSIERAVRLMQSLGIDPENGGVYFGQLLGMADNLSFPLGASGHKAYKYVPYGAIGEVIPYLLRRAHENSDMMQKVDSEVKVLRAALRKRLIG